MIFKNFNIQNFIDSDIQNFRYSFIQIHSDIIFRYKYSDIQNIHILSLNQGIFRGSGQQRLGAQLNFVAYYVLGLPFGCVLAFVFSLGLAGLWLGMTLGLYAIAFAGSLILVWTDWKVQAQEAQKRLS